MINKHNVLQNLLQKLYVQNGLSVKAIARKLRRSPFFVYSHLLHYGIQTRPRTPKREFDIDILRQLYLDKHISLANLAKRFRTDRNTLRKYLIQNGISVRSHFEATPRGKAHYNWQGGKCLDDKGYAHIYVSPNDPFIIMATQTKNHIPEHRYVMAQYLGRPLNPAEIVHHLNGIRTDNRLCNLALVLRHNHQTKTIIKNLQKRIRDLEAVIAQQKLGV